MQRCYTTSAVEVQQHVAAVIQQRLQDILLDVSVPARYVYWRTHASVFTDICFRPALVLQVLSGNSVHLPLNLHGGLFPSRKELDNMLSALSTSPTHVSLAVVDPLVLLSDMDEDEDTSTSDFDAFGYSAYARVVTCLLLHYLDDRDVARQNIWAVRHFQALALYAKDVVHVPSAPSSVFGKAASKSDLEELISKVDRLAAYLLTHSIDDGWVTKAVPRLSAGKSDTSTDSVEALLSGLVNPPGGDSLRESRILHGVLRHLLPNVSKSDADQLVGLARNIEKKGSSAFAGVRSILYLTRVYSPTRFPCDHLLRYAICTGTPKARQTQERTRSRPHGRTCVKGQHRRPLDAAPPRSHSSGSGVGYCVPADAAGGQPAEGVSTVGNVGRRPGGGGRVPNDVDLHPFGAHPTDRPRSSLGSYLRRHGK